MKTGEKKINSLGDLEQLNAALKNKHKDFKARVLICMTGCRALGAKDIAAKFRESLKKNSLEKESLRIRIRNLNAGLR